MVSINMADIRILWDNHQWGFTKFTQPAGAHGHGRHGLSALACALERCAAVPAVDTSSWMLQRGAQDAAVKTCWEIESSMTSMTLNPLNAGNGWEGSK